ncbi:unnamed protein product [Alopecurus aequalis]
MSMGVLLVFVVVLAVGGRLEASSNVSSRGFMDRLMSMKGCGRFAGLVNATANATEIFHDSVVHGGLVVFCPDDKAVAAYEPSFNDLCADGQLAALLYHGVAPASLRPAKGLRFPLPTLATDLPGSYALTIRQHGDTIELRSSSGGVARVTSRMVTGEEVTLVVYLIDAVLLPRETIYCGPLWRCFLLELGSNILTLFMAVVGFMGVLWLGVLIFFLVLLSLGVVLQH